MCRTCDNLRREISFARGISTELTDPTSIVLNKADVKTLEERLAATLAECQIQTQADR